MSTLNYQLPSKFENYQEFDTVKDAVEWLIKSQETFKRHGNEGFVYVSLTDGKLNVVDGYDAIIKAYDLNSDLWHGDADCIHLTTHSGNGGGCHCDTCTAWFCY